MSLRARLLISYILVVVTLLLVIIFTLSALLRDNPFQRELLTQQLRFAVNEVARFSQNAIRSDVAPNAFMRRLGQNNAAGDARVLLLNAETGQILIDNRGELAQQNLFRLSGGELEHLEPEGELEIEGTRWLYAAHPLELSRAGNFALVIATPFEQIPLLRDPIFRSLLNPLLIAAAVALGIASIMAVIVARSVAKPIQRVAAAANAIAEGDIEQTVPVEGAREVKELASSFNDMTEQVRATQESQRALLANVSHELKTPLTSIQGFALAIFDGTAGDDQAIRRSASIIGEESQRMSDMVSELLDLARIETGQLKMKHESVAVDAVLRGCVERLSLRAQEANITLEIDTADNLPTIEGDGDRLAQVFNNLLVNALKHTPADGRVSVSTRDMSGSSVVRRGQMWPGGVEVGITDTGAGIPPEELSRIFERFYQVDKSRAKKKTTDSNLGLGLSIANEIVLAHGGTIHAESVVGLGTKFVVRLPIEMK